MGGEGRGELNKREGWNTMDWMLPGEFFFFLVTIIIFVVGDVVLCTRATENNGI